MCVRWGYWHGSRIEGLLRQQNNFRQNIAINLAQLRLRYGIYTSDNFCWLTLGVTNGKIRALPRRRDPSLKIRARALNLFVKSEPES